MRPKFVFAVLLLASLILGAVFLLKQHLGNTAPPPNPEIAAPAPVVSNVMAVAVPSPASAPAAAATVATNAATDEQHQATIDAETDRLQQWSMNDDPASLSNILADLTSSEKEIRDAAIEAAKQFGSSNAIPVLKAAARNTTDTAEQIALLEAADFLSLPSISEGGFETTKSFDQLKAEKPARQQKQKSISPQGQPPASDQNPSAPNN
jgi:hypothetical protein